MNIAVLGTGVWLMGALNTPYINFKIVR